MAMHKEIGFLGCEDELKGIDKDLQELVKQTYKIPGLGSYGVSCSGHFEEDEEKFYASPWGHLGLIALPEITNVKGILDRLNNVIKEYPDARLNINNFKAPYQFPEYSPEIDLKEFSFERKNQDGLYIVNFQIRASDNGCLGDLKETANLGYGIEKNGNKKVYDSSKKRVLQITEFWKNLEDFLRDYNESNDLLIADFEKKEFF